MQHVRVEHVPFPTRLDHGADPRARVHQALGDQNPRGFAQYRPADGIFLTQQGFGGQFVVRQETSGDDLHAQFLDDARVHAFAVGGFAVIHGERRGPVRIGVAHDSRRGTILRRA
ncbi:hypothetical protein D1872_280630 [compost metagenome]